MATPVACRRVALYTLHTDQNSKIAKCSSRTAIDPKDRVLKGPVVGELSARHPSTPLPAKIACARLDRLLPLDSLCLCAPVPARVLES